MERIPLLEGKHVVLGVTGGIAAYKACSLASRLTKAGSDVDVVMTAAACRFVSRLTFEALTGRPAYTSMWEPAPGGLPTHISHVGLGHGADLVVIAPVTANTMAKLAAGFADDLLSTLALAARCPIMVAPAMDVGMWNHPATKENVKTLRQRDVQVVGPARGRMASGLEGMGRLLEPERIFGHVRLVLGRDGPLVGQHVIVTAGPTRQYLDPVRFLSNPSSGRQGFALAQAALDRGARVTLVSGPVHLEEPVGCDLIKVTTVDEMLRAVTDQSSGADVLLMAAAVGDYQAVEITTEKIKKRARFLTINLERTPDVLASVVDKRRATGFPRLVVGFAAETEDLIDNARKKLKGKDLDLLVANDVTEPAAGFGGVTNKVSIMDREGSVEHLPTMTKAEVAEAVLSRVVARLDDTTGA